MTNFVGNDDPHPLPETAIRYAENAGFTVEDTVDGVLATRPDMDTYFTLKQVSEHEWIWHRPFRRAHV